MRTRVHRTPLSIWIVVGLCLLFAAAKLVVTVNMLMVLAPFGALKFAFGVDFLTAIFALYQAAALARLSRWPALLTFGGVAVGVLSQGAAILHWRESYSLVGMVLMWLPIGVYAVLTLPHWGKMNWAPFGRSYRPSEDQAEVFT